MDHVKSCHPKRSHFTVLVRSIPRSRDMPLDDVIKSFFTTNHRMSYLSHLRVYRSGSLGSIMTNAEKVCQKFAYLRATSLKLKSGPVIHRCSLCGGTSKSFDLYQKIFELDDRTLSNSDSMKTEELIC
ncbi:hypothetical protein AXF42_Ash019831 [Apostasia shenzhenica]|uniref:CSC1/OSCA1-like cytosolic domain-containing protein n=1 Tax=Apostasia shenzhenica TaxID=1088818 RepID=A0A2I0ARF2_9ASPA|nr:hypothetical protein AXF42_Ash019831 [Apostasia shenzhenica]